jgi:hypothetical protein
MDVKQAVEMAKNHIKDLFENEGISNLGLEEVDFDDQTSVWYVTIGFSRPWDKPAEGLVALAQKLATPVRSYKVVRIDDISGKVRSVKNRETKS